MVQERKDLILKQASLISEEQLDLLFKKAMNNKIKLNRAEKLSSYQAAYKMAISIGDQKAANEARYNFNKTLMATDNSIDIENEYTTDELFQALGGSDGDFGLNVGHAMNIMHDSDTEICVNVLSAGGVKTMMKQVKVDPFSISIEDLRVYCDALMNAKKERVRASNAIFAVLNRQDSEIKSDALYNVLLISLRTKEWVEAGYEKVVKAAAPHFPVCQYLVQIPGVGEALASNLYARVQLKDGTNSASSIWSYCGLNDNITPYLGQKGARECVNQAKKVVSDDYRKHYGHILQDKLCFVKLGKAPAEVRRMIGGEAFQKYQGMTNSEKEEIKIVFASLSPKEVNDVIDACVCLYDKQHPSNKEISQIGFFSGRHQNKVRSFTKKDSDELTYNSIIKGLSKPPYNVKAKTIAYQIIECIIRKGTSEYATLYRKRKEYEVKNNEAGLYAEEAARQLRKKNFESENAKKCLLQGKLTPAHIDRRARRYVVKIFLSHYFEILWIEKYGMLPKLAPVFSDGNHYHYIMPEFDYEVFFDVENASDQRFNSNGTPIKSVKISDYEFETYTGKFTKNLSVYGNFVDDPSANDRALAAIYERVAEEKKENEDEDE